MNIQQALKESESWHLDALTPGMAEGIRALIDFAKSMQWRPIEDAPKDGTEIIMYDAETGVSVIGRWGKHNHVPLYGWIRPIELYGEENDGFDPTHFAPLLPVPKGEQ